MALSQHSTYDSLHAPAQQRQSISNQGYPSAQQNMAGSYAHFGLQMGQRGGYNAGQNDPGWTEQVLEEMKDMLLLVSGEGHITYASPSAKQITGRVSTQLEGTTLTEHIHEDDRYIFERDMSEAITDNRPFRAHVRFQRSNNTYGLVEIYGHPHIAGDGVSQGRDTSNQNRCRGFFLMCRPYPSKNSLLLDSFLEHKIENARLVQQIAKLKQEEEEEAILTRGDFGKGDGVLMDGGNGQGVLSDQDSSETAAAISDDSDASAGPDYFSERPSLQNIGLSHIDGIEVMTGLHYGDGERSQGLSTGLRRGRLVHCDIDITTTADQARSAQEGDRRKRLKGQHHCTDCGTGDSPEWRKGPKGPKTLCNACGCKFSPTSHFFTPMHKLT
ncbi:uncharacterized protein N7483_004315 [Penicillium malachiteum]|uniref:uncharacterized protein n=1 Tax=Penicillium malachiteum TaxID=1324776 RepID=UPI002546CBD7|nr:uncharacterized protein N7483_004315 [Penicillium malachiteum]KAJ5729807.1 hypothetical protein N7483_004315 [Penicillium malachiteum]